MRLAAMFLIEYYTMLGFKNFPNEKQAVFGCFDKKKIIKTYY